MLIVNAYDVRRVEQCRAIRADPVPNGRRAKRVLNLERLKANTVNVEWASGLDNRPLGNRSGSHCVPALLSGKYRAGYALLQPVGMVRVGVSDENGSGSYLLYAPPLPVGAAIDHDM